MPVSTSDVIAETLLRAARQATRAPSIHNTQPWTFVVGRDWLEVRADSERQLTVLDPRRRQLTISCGCALFTARVAIAAAGYQPVVELFPDAHRPHVLARVIVGEHRDWLAIADLDAAVALRRTNRRDFLDTEVPRAVVHTLVDAARAEHARLVQIVSAADRATVRRLTAVAQRIEQSDPDYLAELRSWLTSDPHRRDGIQVSSVPYGGEPAAARHATVNRLFDVVEEGWLPSPGDEADECLLVLGAEVDGPDGWLRTGQALQRVWLELTREGYSATPLTQVVEVSATHELMRQELDLDFHPAVLLRVGHAADVPPSNRRAESEVIRLAGPQDA